METVNLSEGQDLNCNPTKIPPHDAKRSSKNLLPKKEN